MPGYDIHFQQVPQADVAGYKLFTFGFTASLKIQGPQALVNRWLKTFFTPKGSDLLSPSTGTLLASCIGGNVTGDLEDLVATAIDDTSEQVKVQDLLGEYPTNECLKSATLIQYTSPTSDSFEVWIRLKNQAGESITIRLSDYATR